MYSTDSGRDATVTGVALPPEPLAGVRGADVVTLPSDVVTGVNRGVYTALPNIAAAGASAEAPRGKT